MIQVNWKWSSGFDHLHISDGHHLLAASHSDVLLLLQGDEGALEVHQEHVGPDQHEAVGTEHQLGANLRTEFLRTKAIHHQAKVAFITKKLKKLKSCPSLFKFTLHIF